MSAALVLRPLPIRLQRRLRPRPATFSYVRLLLPQRPSVETKVLHAEFADHTPSQARLLGADLSGGEATAVPQSLRKPSLQACNFRGPATAAQASMEGVKFPPALLWQLNHRCRLVALPAIGARRAGTHLLALQSARNFSTRRTLGRKKRRNKLNWRGWASNRVGTDRRGFVSGKKRRMETMKHMAEGLF